MGRLDGKVAIITGTAGRDGCRAVAREGAKVVGCDVGEGYPRGRGGRRVSKEVPLPRGPETVVLAEGGEMVRVGAVQPDEPGRRRSAREKLAPTPTARWTGILYNNAAKGDRLILRTCRTRRSGSACTRSLKQPSFASATKAVWPRMVAQKTR